MNIQQATKAHIPALAQFLATCNMQPAHHIGFVGNDVAEISNTLQEDFVDGELLTFSIATLQGDIVATIGFDIDDDTAEVWGPFNTTNEHIEQQLFQTLQAAYRNVRTLSFFINQQNKQQAIVEQLGAKNRGTHCILKANNDEVQDGKTVEHYSTQHERAFIALHNMAFPHTYYDAATILARLNDECALLVATNEQKLIGYAYVEVSLQYGEASLEYFAVAPDYQNKGYGTAILKDALSFMFSFEEICDVTLCVEQQNDSANRVYEKSGFHIVHTLTTYKLQC